MRLVTIAIALHDDRVAAEEAIPALCRGVAMIVEAQPEGILESMKDRAMVRWKVERVQK